MLIISTDYLQAFITKSIYWNSEFKEKIMFTISVTIQINGKLKTTYADIYTVTAESYKDKHKDNECVSKEIGTKFVIDEESELWRLIDTLYNLWYDMGDTTLMWDKISQYISNFY